MPYPVELAYFERQKNKGDGFRAECRRCRRKKNKKYHAQRRQTEIEKYALWKAEWIEKNGPWPLCPCGCGEEPTVQGRGEHKGEPFEFVKGHRMRMGHPRPGRRVLNAAIRIPYSEFRVQVTEIKQARGLTLKQMAAIAGISEGHLRNVMYTTATTRSKGVSKEWAQGFFERLDGVASPPTTFQKRQMVKKAVRLSMDTSRIFGVMVVKNEEHRYLQSCLNWHTSLLDGIFVLDDQSTDATHDIIRSYTDEVLVRPDDVPSFMEDEGALRQFAWDCAAEILGFREGDWVLALDADEFLTTANGSDIRLALDLERSRALLADYESISFRMPEMWDIDGMERTDGYWNRIVNIRLVKWMPNLLFARKKMGGGSVPSMQMRSSIQAEEVCLLHYGYADRHDRMDKYLRYKSLANHGHNPKHIESITATPKVQLWRGNLPEVWRGIT